MNLSQNSTKYINFDQNDQNILQNCYHFWPKIRFGRCRTFVIWPNRTELFGRTSEKSSAEPNVRLNTSASILTDKNLA